MATCYSTYELQPQTGRTTQLQKDYSRPLHVDCSVEYELPNQAKPPAGVRNEPLLMIHPCYFRKIESQRRSPFVNNLPTRQQAVAKRRMQQQRVVQPQQPQVAAQYPVHHHHQPQQAALQQHAAQLGHHQQAQQLWDPLPPLVPAAAAAVQQQYAAGQKRNDPAAALLSSGSADSGHWTDSDRSPEKAEEKHILSGKYRQYLRAHRLHPYVTSSIPLASAFPHHQMQQVCYNV